MKSLVLIFLTAVNLIVSANGTTLEKRDNGMSVMTPLRCPPVCMMYCEFGNVLNAIGCPTCQCKPNPKCGPVCRMYCEFGNVLDVNGCPICQCNPNPNCPRVCRIYCQFGNVMDANGCPICRCNPAPRNLASLPDTSQGGRSGLLSNAFTAVDRTAKKCPGVCEMFCLFGNVLDANGCPICDCNPAPNNLGSLPDTSQARKCPHVCRLHCEFGNVFTADGCKTCQCKPNPNCPPVCAIFCQYGNVMDANRCKTCQCNPAPSDLASLPDTTLQGGRSGLFSNAFTAVDTTDTRRCPKYKCSIFCVLGKRVDANGCPICSCEEYPDSRSRGVATVCLPIMCPPCPYGYVIGHHGCPNCQCKPNPNCPPVCDIFCQFGNVLDANGCKTCKCNPAPSNLASLSDSSQGGRSGLVSNAFTAVDTTVRSRCSPIKCLIYCEYGNVVDANGCSTCSCKDYPDSASRAAQPLCPPIMCFVCPYGNVVQENSNGCPICNCKMYPTTINLD
ncbi:unnamed protein product [Gordionus sp. m RMFG-2023]|uniref:cysteine-rich motor neuron 1 protein-like n=1 Tax=Gordionus sp. m RMFG-2023 TaxID=3053472 RepID=UPI0030E2C022